MEQTIRRIDATIGYNPASGNPAVRVANRGAAAANETVRDES
jgi:hypothetical protein